MNTPNVTRNIITTLALSAAGLVGIAGYEGYRGDAYRDSVGVPTIGYGETKNVKMGQKTTPDRALAQLLKSANEHADGVRKCVSVPLYQHEFDIYVSLAFNVGVGTFCKSTLVKKLNAGDYAGACAQLKRFKYAGGKVLPGLASRRESEYQRCMGAA